MNKEQKDFLMDILYLIRIFVIPVGKLLLITMFLYQWNILNGYVGMIHFMYLFGILWVVEWYFNEWRFNKCIKEQTK